MLETLLVLNFVGMILVPLFAAFYFARKFKLSWKLFLTGGLTFIASQVLHIPLVLAINTPLQQMNLIVIAIVLGLLAGIFEETARYVLYKFILKKNTTWDEGVYVGLGHGGTEAILLGILAGLTFVNMVAYRYVDLATLPNIPPEQLEVAKQQMQAYWSTPTNIVLLGLAERIFAMCLHVALSVMVLYAVVNHKMIWFWLAILWHAIVDASAVYLIQNITIIQVEAVIAVCALISLGIVFLVKSKMEQNAIASRVEDVT